ncbi:MAG: YlxR family protein, partial [Myxococcota bacterium]
MRTCAVTRESASPGRLVRVVLGPDGVVEVDYHAKLGGRGAWLTPSREVFATAEAKPGILARALDAEGGCVTAGLLEKVRAANLRAVGELLSLSARAGALASGGE